LVRLQTLLAAVTGRKLQCDMLCIMRHAHQHNTMWNVLYSMQLNRLQTLLAAVTGRKLQCDMLCIMRHAHQHNTMWNVLYSMQLNQCASTAALCSIPATLLGNCI
jgi:hypothetical protein